MRRDSSMGATKAARPIRANSGPLGGSPSFRVNLVMVTRSALVPNYRSDAMHLERLHWEAAVDRHPEALAAELRDRFAEA